MKELNLLQSREASVDESNTTLQYFDRFFPQRKSMGKLHMDYLCADIDEDDQVMLTKQAL